MKEESVNSAAPPSPGDLSTLVISLLKGVVYREADEQLWGTLINLQVRIRDYVSVLALDLVLDEAEGYRVWQIDTCGCHYGRHLRLEQEVIGYGTLIAALDDIIGRVIP